LQDRYQDTTQTERQPRSHRARRAVLRERRAVCDRPDLGGGWGAECWVVEEGAWGSGPGAENSKGLGLGAWVGECAARSAAVAAFYFWPKPQTPSPTPRPRPQAPSPPPLTRTSSCASLSHAPHNPRIALRVTRRPKAGR